MLFLRNKCILITSLIAASSVVQAQAEEGFTIAPSVGYYNSDNRDNFDSDPAYSLGLGYQFANPWAVEFTYLNADSKTSTGTSVDLNQFRLDALYHLEESNGLTPYVAAGVGILDFTPGLNNPLINAGGGLKYALNDSTSLRGDLRLIRDTEDHKTDYLTTVGLHFAFGNSFDQSTTSEQKDTDNDGIFDKNDQCLNTPAGVSVDAKGCALDDDKDGVANHIDQCLNTPSGVSVDAKGCTLDDDKDGVVNSIDMCPNSVAGAEVDSKGCYVALDADKTITLDVQFANDSALIDQKYYVQIEEVADFLTAYPETDAVIEGHTDDRGTDNYNQALSEKRAQAVAGVLINSFNISKDRVSVIAYGEEKPVVSNDTAENRAVNRRVRAILSN